MIAFGPRLPHTQHIHTVRALYLPCRFTPRPCYLIQTGYLRTFAGHLICSLRLGIFPSSWFGFASALDFTFFTGRWVVQYGLPHPHLADILTLV